MNNPHVSIIIPAHNEEENLASIVNSLHARFAREEFSYEIIIVNDNSTDNTSKIAESLSSEIVKVVHREPPNGFGMALKDGLKRAGGDILIPVMGDLSDKPEDIVKLIRKSDEGYDVVYGSRFIDGGKLIGYPPLKLLFNRGFNMLVRILYGLKEKDITNAFKAYRREVIERIGIENLESEHFDLLVELPVKAHLYRFKSTEVPVTWYRRKKGVSKLNLVKMGPIYVKRVIKMMYTP